MFVLSLNILTFLNTESKNEPKLCDGPGGNMLAFLFNYIRKSLIKKYTSPPSSFHSTSCLRPALDMGKKLSITNYELLSFQYFWSFLNQCTQCNNQ